MSAPRQILDRLAALGITPTGVADDSRQVRPGDLFLAYPGDLADGRRYIADAIARGAVAILWQPGGDFAWNPAWTLGPAGASVVAANLQIDYHVMRTDEPVDRALGIYLMNRRSRRA